MNDEEIEEVRCQVDAIAAPLTLLALMWLLANPDTARTDGSAYAWGRTR